MSNLNFEQVLALHRTEKADLMAETGVYVFNTKANVTKRTVAFLFNKKYGKYPLDVRSCALRVETKSRMTRTSRCRIYRKFIIRVPEGIKIDLV